MSGHQARTRRVADESTSLGSDSSNEPSVVENGRVNTIECAIGKLQWTPFILAGANALCVLDDGLGLCI
jgi:hypothetical protein